MSEEKKTKTTETSGPDKSVTPPKVVYVTDSWDGASTRPASGKGQPNGKSEK